MLEPGAPEARAPGHDLGAGAPTQAGCGEHVLPGRGRLLQDLGLDLLVEAVVRSGIAAVGDGTLAVAKVLAYVFRIRKAGKRYGYDNLKMDDLPIPDDMQFD